MNQELRIKLFKKLVFLALFFILTALFFSIPVYASEDIGYSTIHPASPLYFLKSSKEILELKFAKESQEKGLKYLEFAERRIREAKSLINVNRADLIPPVLERYWSNLNKTLGLLNFKDQPFSSQVIEKIKQHIMVLETLQKQTENQKAKIAIGTVIYRLSGWQAKLLERLTPEIKTQLSLEIAENNSLICNFLSKESSSSALNQTEKAVLLARAQKCLKQ